MRRLRMSRDAFAACLAAVSIAGCGAGEPSRAALPAAPAARAHANLARFAHAGSWLRHDASSSGDLVYMAQGQTVGIYSFAGKMVGALKGLEGVEGLCSDPLGNVWVTYGASLLEYARGGTVPIAQLYTASGALSCAVDPTTGDIAATQGSIEGGEGSVAVYTDIYGTPQTYTDSDMNYYAFCSYDSQGNLFVNGARSLRKGSVLAELPVGGSTLASVKMDEKFEKIGGLQWDGQYVAIGDSLKHVIYQMSVSGGQATTISTSHFHDWTGPRFKTIEPFAIANGEIVLTFSDRQTGFWKFPAGGNTIRRMTVLGGAKTISIAASGVRRGGE